MDKQDLINSLKEWWKTTANRDATQLKKINTDAGITIGDNNFTVVGTHVVHIYANDKTSHRISLINCGAPDNERELIQFIITKLDEAQDGGRRKYKTISNKQRRKKSIKYRKKQKTNRR
jgi:hypothetical protein